MKKMLLLLALALGLITLSTPRSLAYEKNPWKAIERMVPDLNQGFDNVVANQKRFGSSPDIRSQIKDLRFRLDRWNALVAQRAGDPSVVRKAGENIGFSEKQLVAQIRSGPRPGTEVHVHHHFW